jgi:hypothetical protein
MLMKSIHEVYVLIISFLASTCIEIEIAAALTPDRYS